MVKDITISCADPLWDGLIDEDILDRFEDSSVFYGDIINAQLIKTNTLLLSEIKKLNNTLQNKE